MALFPLDELVHLSKKSLTATTVGVLLTILLF